MKLTEVELNVFSKWVERKNKISKHDHTINVTIHDSYKRLLISRHQYGSVKTKNSRNSDEKLP